MAFQKISGLLSPTTDAYQAKLNKLFGNGLDGNIIYASGVNFLTRDYYFTNLTVNSGATLFTNGFKIFVKETLTNNGTVGMPIGTSQTTSVMGGSVLTRNDGNISYNSANAIGGSITVSQITNFDELVSGSRTVGGELQKIYAGAVGATGDAGTAGNAGTANPGGAGTSPATPGNPGTAGTAGTGGTGGAGGQGGGMVVILAKIVTGSGTFVSEGTAGVAGNPGNPGNAGSAGNTGSTSPGTSHPGNPYSHINPHTQVPTHTAAAPFHQANPDGASHIAAATNPGYGIAHNIAQPYHFHSPGNPFHNPGGTQSGHNPGHHAPGRHTAATKYSAARHTPGAHAGGNPWHHYHPGNPGHNSARLQPAHYLGNQHTHPTFHHIHTAATHNTHPTPHTQGHNPAVDGHTHQANPNTTGINPAGHNATVPGGAAGTGNPGNPGTAGATGATGQVGAVVILGQEVTASVSTSTVIADIG